MKTKIFACESIKEELLLLQPKADITFTDYQLHGTPQALHQRLGQHLEQVTDCEGIILGFGLCSNAVVGLSHPQCQIVIPRVHDCISMLVGSTSFTSSPGSFYLSRGWIDYGSDPMKEYHQYMKKYDSETARWLIEELYGGYEKLILIHNAVCTRRHVAYARQVAEFMAWEFEIIDGSLDLIRKMVDGKWDEEFQVIPAGTEIFQQSFFCRGNCNAKDNSITI